jgi:hypothetical protein
MLLTFALYGDDEQVEKMAVDGYSVSEELLVLGGYQGSSSSSSSSSSSKTADYSKNRASGAGMRSRSSNNSGSQVTLLAQGAATDNDMKVDNRSDNGDVKKNKKDGERVKNLADMESMRGSPPAAMRDTIRILRENYGGSVLGYLDAIGFNAEYRKRLQRASNMILTLTNSAGSNISRNTAADRKNVDSGSSK